MSQRCPMCGAHVWVRVLYYGLPHWFCLDCAVMCGFWSRLTRRLPVPQEMACVTIPPGFAGWLKGLSMFLLGRW